MNLFFALPLPGDLRAALGALPRPEARATWARAEGLHLTLAFLGPRPEGEEGRLGSLLADFAGRHGSFQLRTAAMDGFPSLQKARVLWLGLEEEPRLRRLALDLRHRLDEAGQAFDARPFVPHITLARMKAPADLGNLPSPTPRAFTADRVALYRSRRLSDGARYELLAEARLVPSSSLEGEP